MKLISVEQIDRSHCDACGAAIERQRFAIVPHGSQTVCYDCCAVADDNDMRVTGKATLYLVKLDGKHYVTNWPGTLKFPVWSMRVGKHNMAGKRYDVAFTHGRHVWHGVTYGDMTQICHCKRTKTEV